MQITLLEFRNLLVSPALRSIAGMANRQGDVRLVLRASLRPQLTLWLGLAPLTYFIHLPMKMEPTVSSETSAVRTRTPGNYPKRNKLHLEHGKSLKTRPIKHISCTCISPCHSNVTTLTHLIRNRVRTIVHVSCREE